MPLPRRRHRHIFRYALWAVTTLLAIAAFGVATPYVFLAVGRIHPHSWAQFSNEGQAYGGIAAVIGMLAIVGVVASLILQARESMANRVQMERLLHADLLKMGFGDPELIECWGVPPGDSAQLKKVGYVNLIFSYLSALFEIGRMSEDGLRRGAAEIFAGDPARTYWRDARSSWEETPASRVSPRFIAILDEEHQRALAKGAPVRWPEREEPASRAIDRQSMIRHLVIGTACGAAIAWASAALHRYSQLL